MASYPPVNWIAPDGGDRPSFSRDGSRIVYQIGDSLYTIYSDGGTPSLLLRGTDFLVPSRADWSWSPETIAFGGHDPRLGITNIWLIESNGTSLRQLPTSTLGRTTYPSWYSDLQSIVAVDASDPRFRALWRFTVDGSAEPVQLTTTEDFCAGRPSVAPGGANARVAFAGTRGPFNENSNQIWVVAPPSLEPQQLDPGQGRSPNWSPDGKWILFESNRLTGGNYQLFITSAPGPLKIPPVPITDPSIFAQHGEWSRQQDRIVFERGNGQALGVIEVPEPFRASP